MTGQGISSLFACQLKQFVSLDRPSGLQGAWPIDCDKIGEVVSKMKEVWMPAGSGSPLLKRRGRQLGIR
jgi:hypothetical protein